MTAVIEQTNTGFGAFIEEVPGVGVAGDTIEETDAQLRTALAMHFEADPSAIPLTYKMYHPTSGFVVTSTVPIVAKG